RHNFDGLEGKTVLLVGAGEMAEMAGKHLVASGASKVLVANRTFERAEALAATLNGQAVPFDRMNESLILADVVVCSTASPTPVITKEMVAAVLKPRKHRPLFLVDLAVPRDVDPAVHELEGVYSYDVDDIQKVIAENQAARAAAAAKAEVLVAEEVARYIRQRAVREQVPVLAQLRARAEQIRRAELERALANLPVPLTPDQAKVVEAMTSAIINKMLHQPTAKLRAVQSGESELAEAAAELFGLDGAARKANEG
ncbi:MAG TPA: glutamyl-tRNA reductase, partial [Myxococcaceae bacterium]|nr:glutamyl-tRNA reductase [Myxococcaceae bacterium]